MALIPGQNLADSEHDKKTKRRSLLYSPLGQTAKVNEPSGFLTGARDVISNTLFNVVDSALFGIPSSRLEANTETISGGMFKMDRRTYGDGYESLGIKPFEELSGAGKFGLGLGQAAGFFIPYSGVSKATKAGARFFFSNADELIGSAIKNGTRGLDNLPGTTALEGAMKASLDAHKKTLPHVFRADPQQYARYSEQLKTELGTVAQEHLSKLGLPRQRIQAVADDIVNNLQKFGEERKYIDDINDVIAAFGIKDNRGNIAANAYGYVGRVADLTTNMFVYESIGNLARASLGEPVEGVDYDALNSLKHSAGFSAVISLADFIPGGRKAGMFSDFYKLARTSLKGRRSFTDLVKSGKMNEDQLRTTASYFATMGNLRAAGKSAGDLKAGRGTKEDLAKWLDDLYSANKKELTRAIMKDGGRSLVSSLPRAAVDGIGTALYLNGTENFMNALHDESMIGDYLVGAFMAMRAYQPINPRNATRWRYDNTIDARFNLMRNLGVDVSQMEKAIPHMKRQMHDINFEAVNLESIEGSDQIYNTMYNQALVPEEGSKSGEMGKRSFLTSIHEMFMSRYMRDKNNNAQTSDAIQESINLGNVPNIYSLSDNQINKLFEGLQDVETSSGRSIKEYYDSNDFNRFYEDFMKPSVENHKDKLLLTVKKIANEFGLVKADDLITGKELVLKDFRYSGDDPRMLYMLDLIRTSVGTEKVKIEKDSSQRMVDIGEQLKDADKSKRFNDITDDYHDNVATMLDSNFNYNSFNNPSLDFIKRYNTRVAVNKLKEIARGEVRPDSEVQRIVNSAIDEAMGGRKVANDVTFKIELPKDASDDQIQTASRIEDLLYDIAGVRKAAKNVEAGSKVRNITLEDAMALESTLVENSFAEYNPSTNSYLLGGVQPRNLMSSIRADEVRRSGLTETDYIVFEALRQDYGDSDGRLSLPSVDLYERVLHTNEFGETEFTRNPEYNGMINEYSDLLSRLVKTGQVEEVQGNAKFEPGDITKLIGTINLVKEIYGENVKAEYDSAREFVSELSRKTDEFLTKFSALKRKSEGNTIETGELSDFLSSHRSMLDEHQLNMGAAKSILQSIDDVIAAKNSPDLYNLEQRLFKAGLLETMQDSKNKLDAISQLVNFEASKEAYSVSGIRLRQTILQKMVQEGLNTADNLSSKKLDELLFEYASSSSYEQVKQLVKSANAVINHSIGNYDYGFIKDVNERELREIFESFSSSQVRDSYQSFVTRLRNLGLDGLLDDNNGKLSDDAVAMLTDADNFVDNLKSITDSIRQKMGEVEYNDARPTIMREMVATTVSLNLRNYSRRYVRLEGDGVTRNEEAGIQRTPLDDFIDSMSGIGVDMVMIKNDFIDGDRVKRLTDGDMSMSKAQEAISNNVQKLFDKVKDKELKDSLSKGAEEFLKMITKNAGSEKGIENPVFIPLQASDDIGVLFVMNRQSVEALKGQFDKLNQDVKASTSDKARLAQWDLMYRTISKGLATDGETKRDVENAVRALFNFEKLGGEFFWSTVGKASERIQNGEVVYSFDYQSQLEGQSKVTKYIHKVNNKNAVRYDKPTLKMISEIINSMSDKTDTENMILSHLKRREERGISAFVWNDENGAVGTTAKDIVEYSVNKRFPNLSGEQKQRMIDNTLKERGAELKSLTQSLFDGSFYASKEAMATDVFLMGEDFDNGARAAKIGGHNAENNILLKGATRYLPELEGIMKELDVDYIIPNSVAKIMSSKDNNLGIDSYRVGDGLESNLKDLNLSKDSQGVIRGLPVETMQYMFSGHAFGTRANSNSSVTHFWNWEALRDYNNELAINTVVDKISTQISFYGNAEQQADLSRFYMNQFDQVRSEFSHLSYVEQMIQWGIQSNNSMVRSSIMRFIRDKAYQNAVTRKTEKVSNTFLFADSRLSSPIYGTTSDGTDYVKAFGEIRLSDDTRNMSLDRNLTIVFNADNSDHMFNAEDRFDVFSPALDNNRSDELMSDNGKHSREALTKLYKYLRPLTFGEANQFLKKANVVIDLIRDENLSDKLSDDFYSRSDLSKEMVNTLQVLASSNIGDLSLGVNPHKIPKKFGPDSIVNRVEGFVNVEKGNITELNNYEIALQHQADQDGDKVTTYLANPFSAMKISARNMGLAREPETIKSEIKISPNMYGMFDRSGKVRGVDNGYRIAENNMLDYVSQERQSKFIVGSTVKMQGVFTMLNVSGLRHNGSPILDMNSPEAADFHKVIGSITQSILDAWSGVHPSLLDVKNIKDFILFGDSPSGLNMSLTNPAFSRWSNRGGLFNLDNIPEGQRDVYKDLIRSYVSVFEDAYSSFGDKFEGGVQERPTYDVIAKIHYKTRNVLRNGISPVYKGLLWKYKKNNQWDKFNYLKGLIERKTDVQGLTTIDQLLSLSPRDTNNRPISDVENHIYSAYPQLTALKEFAERGKVIDDKNNIIRQDSFFDDMFYHEDSNILDALTKDTNVDDIYPEANLMIRNSGLEYIYQGLDDLVNKKDSKASVTASQRLSVLERTLQTKSGQLKRLGGFYQKTGQQDKYSDVINEAQRIDAKLDEINDRLKILGRTAQTQSIKLAENKSYKNNSENNVYVYTIERDGEFRFEESIKPGEFGKTRGKEIVVLKNPIKTEKFDQQQVHEGLAMEAVTLPSIKNDRMSTFVINRTQQIKHELRNIANDIYSGMEKYSSQKNELYSDQRFYSDMAITKMLGDITNTAMSSYGSADNIDFYGIVSAIMLPRVVPRSVVMIDGEAMPYYKVDNNFTKAFATFVIENRNSATVKPYYEALNLIMTDFGKELHSISTGRRTSSEGKFSMSAMERMHHYSVAPTSGAESLMKSLGRVRGQDYILDKALLTTGLDQNVVDYDGSILFRDRTDFDTRNDKCPIF